MALYNYLSHIRQLLAEDQLSLALQQLRALLENSPKLSEVIQQLGRFADLSRQIRLGILEAEIARVGKNQIRFAVLELLDEIEKEGAKPALKTELERAVQISHSKNVASGTFQAGGNIRIGDEIHYHQGLKIPRLLTGLPFIPENFQGREIELLHIHQRLFAPQGNLLLLVNGEGGIGKTSLASRYFYTYQEHYAHLAWVFSEKNLGSALLQMAIPLGLQFDEKADTMARLQGLLQHLFELKKPCLLVIDNANDLAELRQYLPLLQRCSNFHLLFTTRISDFPQVAFYKIDPLPQEQALQIFKSHYPAFESSEEGLFLEIYQAVQGNTLVLELLAKNLRNFNNKLKKHYQLADLRRDLEQGLLQLSKSSTIDVRYQAKGDGLRSEKIEVIIAAMYELGELSEAERQLLSVFAVLPAESIPFERLETLLSAQEELDKTLLDLAQKGWLEYNDEAAAFKCSPVVQEVVRLKQNEVLLEHCRTLVDSLCEQLDAEHRHLDNYLHSSLFLRYGEAVLVLFPMADDDLGTLWQNIGAFYADTGDLLKALDAYQRMERVQSSLLEENPDDPDFKNGLAISYSKLGQTHSDLGNLQQALTFFEEYNKLEKELFASYPQNVSFKNGLAISYSKLGDTHRDLGNLQQALTFFEEYNNLEKELFVSYPQNVSFKNGLAISYSKLGQTHSDLGNLQQALTFFEQYNKLEKELFASYPQNVNFKYNLQISFEKLGDINQSLGNIEHALNFYLEENQLLKELYDDYPQNVSFKNGLAISYEKLGDTHSALGNLQQALTFFEERNRLGQELFASYPQNVSFKNGLAISYSKLGQTHRALGNLQQALTFFEERNRLGQELFASYPQNVSFKNGLALSYQWLGIVHRSLNNLEQALHSFQEFLELEEALSKDYPLNVSFKSNLAYAHKLLGLFYRDQKNDAVQAKIHFQQCHDIWQALAETYPAYAEFSRQFNWVKETLEAL